MRMFVRSIATGLLFVLLLVACGKDNSAPTPIPGQKNINQPTDTAVPVPTTAPTPEPATVKATPDSSTETGYNSQEDNGPEHTESEDLAPGDFPLATIRSDEGGPVSITGVVTYTSPFFTAGVAEPVVILEDQAGFVDRNRGFIMPPASQTLGQITSDFFQSPFSYQIALPIEPQGTPNDVDHDGQEDDGVQIFAIAHWTNKFGDPFLEERDLDGGGWSTAYASTLVSDDADTEREVIGGKLLIFSPDDKQGFPAGFGADGLLFTQDDPIVLVPQGYSLVDLDSDPFIFDRSRTPIVDLIEPDSTALVDNSALGYAEAFDALVEQLSREYAFTEYKGVDWASLHEQFRPLFEVADAAGDALAYRRALRDFSWAIPDGHVSGPFVIEDYREATSGGLGLALQDLTDERTIVSFLTPGGPADEAGIELASQIFTLNGSEIDDAVDNAIAYSAPFSTEHDERLQKLRYVTRYPLGSEVDITWTNPGEQEIHGATLTAANESASFQFTSIRNNVTGFELPLDYEYLGQSGLGYVQIFSFFDNELLTIQLWERLMDALNEKGVPGLIIDLRQNAGGNGFLANQMAAYFFDKPLILGNSGRYDDDIQDFYFDSRTEQRFYLPSEELRYKGDVAVLVGPNCTSACEFFAYDLSLEDRSAIIGHYPTGGLGGSIERVLMPEGEFFTFTQGRFVDADGTIHIEGIGVPPTIVVPVDERTVFGQGDILLDSAIAHLSNDSDAEIIDGGGIILGEQATGTLVPGTRVRYELALKQGDIFTLSLNSDEFEAVLGTYDELGNELGSTAGAPEAVVEELEAPFDLVLIIEVAALDNGGGDYTLFVEKGGQ